VRRHRRGRRLLVPPALALALAVSLGAAGCGSSPTADAQVASANGTDGVNTDAPDEATQKEDREKAGLEFAKCMREHGVDMPDPQTGPDGGGFIMVGPSDVSAAGGDATAGPTTGGLGIDGEGLPEEFKAADEACRHILDDLIQDGGPPMDAEAQDRALEFAKCMREHGVDMPDPDFSGGGGGFSIRIGGGADGGIDPGSQTFQDAQKACGGMFGPGGKGGPGEVHSATSGAVRS
jgi:hypothetical protein